MAVKIDRSALKKAREDGAIPTRPVTSSGPWGTSDPNYPLLRFTAYKGQKILLHIPNLISETIRDEDDLPEVDMDIYNLHSLDDGSKYGASVRCVRGISLPAFGLDGNCPICDLSSEYTSFIRDTLLPATPAYATALANNGGDTSADEVRAAARPVYEKFKKVENGRERYTIPVALVETTSVKSGVTTILKPVVEVKQDEDGNEKKVPKISYWYLDLSSNQFEKLKTSYREGFDDSDEGAAEDANALYNSWVSITVPDTDDNLALGRDLTFARYARAERKKAEDAKVWATLEKGINKHMTESNFDSLTAMEVLTKNRILSREELASKLAPLAKDLADFKSQAEGKSSIAEIEAASTENALDSLLEDDSAGQEEISTTSSTQGTASASEASVATPESATDGDDDIF